MPTDWIIRFSLSSSCLLFTFLASALWASVEKPNAARDADLSKADLTCPGCNIILLNIELLRADHVGLIHTQQATNTPHIDQFFSHSLIFEDVSAPAGESYRSNLSVQTAKHSFNFPTSEKDIHEFIGQRDRSERSEKYRKIEEILTRFPSMAEFFRAAGMYTVSLNQGIRAGRYLLLDRGFEEVVNWSRQRVSYIDTVNEFIEKIRALKGRRFLIHYRPEVLHPFPYYYPESRSRITSKGEIYNLHRPRYARYSIRISPTLPQERKRELHHRIYKQQVRYVDDELSRIFAAIRADALDESSIIVLYANHGSGLGDNGVNKLAVSYQSCIHVPLLIRHPKLGGAVRIAAPVPLIDLVPTLLEMTGLDAPVHFDGISLLREFSKGKDPHPHLIGRNDFDEYIRKGHLKLIVKHEKLLELYNLKDDPSESTNLRQHLPFTTRDLKAALERSKVDILQKIHSTNTLLHKFGYYSPLYMIRHLPTH